MMEISFLNIQDAENSGTVCRELDRVKVHNVTIYPGFLKAVMDSFGLDGYYLAATEGSSLVGCAAFYRKRNVFGKDCLITVPGGFWAQGAEAERGIIQEAERLAGRDNLRGPLFPDMHNPLHSLPSNVLSYRAVKRIAGDENDLMESYSGNIRRNLRQARKNGLRVLESGDIGAFYGVWAQNMRDLGTPPVPKSFFENLYANFLSRMVLLAVHKGEKIIGGALLLRAGEYATDIYFGSLRSTFHLNPNVLLYHEMQIWALKNGVAVMDLGRSQQGSGNERFKLRFGAELLPLYSSSRSTIREGWVFPILVRGWKLMPLRLSGFLGPLMRRYLPFG